MAEIVLSAFLTVLFEKLASESLKKLARSKGISSQLKKVKRSLILIKGLLNDASQKEITYEAVKEWLNGLQHLAYDIDDLLDDLATEAMHREFSNNKVRRLIPTRCHFFSIRTRMHGKLDDITARLRDLLQETNSLGLSVKDETPRNINRRLETALIDTSRVVGREGDKDVLLQKLLGDEPSDENFSIVPIVGMGGVGKSTLARVLYEEKEIKDHFELKAWVTVSGEFDIFGISRTIFQSIDGRYRKFNDLNLLQVALKEKLSKKRFLFVLDDVWSESYTNWEILARPFLAGAIGSKIIMTTRKSSLLTQLGYNNPYSLSVLSHDNAISLFCQHALGKNNFDSNHALKPYGEGIVAKCDGLPLALITLGRSLRTKTDDEEWKEVLNSEIWMLGKTDEILPALRLSYNDLSASLKLLFAYCSLFPKYYVFDMEELILLWMAEGFLQKSNAGKSMQRLGLECFKELLSRSFFQCAADDKSLFVMHALMNDLATSVAGEFFSRLDIEKNKEITNDYSEKYRHMSFVCENYMSYQRFHAFNEANNLRTFLALSSAGDSWKDFYLSDKILADLLLELPLLRVLSVRQLMITKVPDSIGSLKHLRYLNLSQTKITYLPDNVCNLYNLQTLIVSGCQSLEKLPNNFSKLKNLQHFDMSDTPLLTKMPLGIGELKSLRTLSKIIIEGDDGFSITQLKDLKDLQGKVSFMGLDKVRSPTQAQNLSNMRLSELEMRWGAVFDGSRKETLEKDVLNVLKPHNVNLEKLRIVSYGGIEFPHWIGDPSFLRLNRVLIHGCMKCTSLPLLGQLPSLKVLYIQDMNGVKAVGLEFLGTTGVAFPSLEALYFNKMKGWEVWSTNNSGVLGTPFPRLQQLQLADCPNLVKVSMEALPSLRVLRISECGHEVLRSLVRVASSVTELNIGAIAGLNNQVWRGVMKYLRSVEQLRIQWCAKIRYLWESEAKASKVLVNLRKLEVWGCKKLVSFGEKDEDNCGSNLSSLRILSVQICHSLERCSVPNGIESLNIANSSVTYVSFPTGGGKKLKSFYIGDCEELLEEELGGGEKSGVLINSNMRTLEVLAIKSWKNLKSITELSCFIHLTSLIIEDCPNMESFPDRELSNLTMLKHVIIKNCQSMEASFPGRFWPPKMSSLEIGGLKKSISKWGPQNYPTSVVDLRLIGGESEDVSDFRELSHLLSHNSPHK